MTLQPTEDPRGVLIGTADTDAKKLEVFFVRITGGPLDGFLRQTQATEDFKEGDLVRVVNELAWRER